MDDAQGNTVFGTVASAIEKLLSYINALLS
jgi:hypothetical protein